jgi:hypothetical protein
MWGEEKDTKSFRCVSSYILYSFLLLLLFLSFFLFSFFFFFFFFFFPYNKAFNRNNFCNTKRKLIDADMYRDRYMLHGKTDI